jgi:uridine phosphorylase
MFHLGLNQVTHDLPTMFGNVKFLLTGGSASRIREIAKKLVSALPAETKYGEYIMEDQVKAKDEALLKPIGSTERYEMYKVGPVLLCNHGMGSPSCCIMLHEITKLLHYAGAVDPVYMRLGTSGGIGVEPGSVIVCTEGVDGMLESSYSLPILGEMVSRPTQLDQTLADAVTQASAEGGMGFPVEQGRTMATDCFYEGQGRIDGAMCGYTEEDKLAWLAKLQAAGVKNMEMEVARFAAFTRHLGIRAAVCNVTLLDRTKGDQHPHTHEEICAWSERPGIVAIEYIKRSLGLA